MIIYSDGLYPQRHQDFETICISLLKQEKKNIPVLGKLWFQVMIFWAKELDDLWTLCDTGVTLEKLGAVFLQSFDAVHTLTRPLPLKVPLHACSGKKSWCYFSGVMNKDFSYKVRVWCTNCNCIIWTWIVYCTSESGENSILFAKRICHWMFLFQLFLLEHTANVASFRKGFQIWGSSFWRCIPTYVKFFEIFEGSVDDHFILIWPDHRGHKHLQKVN